MALGMAFNGASMGGVLLGPLWVALIAGLGFPVAAAILGGAMVVALGIAGALYLGRTPAAMGLGPDGDAPAAVAPRPAAAMASPWRDARFATLAGANALCLFGQLGLVAHLVSLLAPALGGQGAGFAMALATACAMAGRALAGWLLTPGMSRRRVFAANAVMQAGGVALLATTGEPALLLLATAIFGFGIGNATTLPPLIAQQDFAEADVGRVVALLVASGQATYAFAPAAFGLLREVDAMALFAGVIVCEIVAAWLMLVRTARPG
jgi:hypothetical protein